MSLPEGLKPPRAILFDWDNTLVDNWPAIHDALNTTFAAMGHGLWTLDETKARLRKNTERAVQLGIFGAPSFVVDGELFWD